jgi:signal transduction histidine kinase
MLSYLKGTTFKDQLTRVIGVYTAIIAFLVLVGMWYMVDGEAEEVSNLMDTEFDDLLFILSSVVVCVVISVVTVRKVSDHLAAPITQLTEQITHYQHNQDQAFPTLDRQDELGDLSRAYRDLVVRLESFIEREHAFTRYASHELRTPMTVIQGNLDLISPQLQANPVHQRAEKRMRNASQRMQRLIDTFLAISREQHTQHAVQLDQTDIEELIDDVLLYAPDETHARLSCDVDSNATWQADPLMASIIVDNLLRNALTHSQQAIHVHVQSHSITITNATDDTHGDSHGIGMDLIHRIAELYGWEVTQTLVEGLFYVQVVFCKEGNARIDPVD